MTTVTDIGPASVVPGPARSAGPDGPVAEVDPVRVLQATADCVFTQARAEADLLEAAARWADLNPVSDDSPCAADWWDGEGVPVPGQIPEVAAPAVMEFAAAAGMSSRAGKWLIFEALQLRHRMPATWTLVRQCRMRAFRARQLVMACYRLNDDAVRWLDRQMAAVVGNVGTAQIERMVMQAASLFDPEYITDQQRKRYVRIDHGDPNSGLDGAAVQAVVDPLDAVDLDAALNVEAEARKAWGSTGDHDERRAAALGDLARARLGETPLPLTPERATGAPAGPEPVVDPSAGAQPGARPGGRGVPPLVGRPRELTLYVHLSDQAILGGSDDRTWLGEYGPTGQLVTADLVRQWCGNPGATVVVKPVIDLRAPIVTEVYRPSARQREHVALDDPTCAFPFCGRPVHPVRARRQPDGSLDESWDADHVRAWRDGEDTSTEGLVGLCRQHHRGKTLHGWRYRQLADGLVLWRSRYGMEYLRTPTGTVELGHHVDRRYGRSGRQVPGWLEDAPVRPPDEGEPPPDPAGADQWPEPGPPSDTGARDGRGPTPRARCGHDPNGVQDRLPVEPCDSS